MNERALKKVQTLYEGHGQARSWYGPREQPGAAMCRDRVQAITERYRSAEYWTAPVRRRFGVEERALDQPLQLAL